MRQSQLNRQVAKATGESVSTIKRLGFLWAESIIPMVDPDDPRLGPHMVDWEDRLDDVDTLRRYYEGGADDVS